jgi:perosamine synthetase
MTLDRISVAGPSITSLEIQYVTDAVTNAWHENANVYHERFERAFAEYIGVRFAVALPSCTSAIHLALAARGIGPGDEVIVPDITWIASAAPISYVGASPLFADIDRATWCATPNSVEACITERTKAIIPVDLYGSMPAMDELRDLADSRGILLVEDAAEAFGSEYRGRKAGSWGHCGVFSFHGSKTMTTGEGGMLVTDDEALYRRVLFLRDHGRKPGDTRFFNTEVAFKYKMSSMQAALGLAQTERAEELVAQKRRIFNWYQDALAHLPGVTLNAEQEGTRNSYWMTTAIFDPDYGLGKETVIQRMKAANIDCRPFFHPLSSLLAYTHLESAKAARMRNRVSYEISPYGINLPSGLQMTEELVDSVCSVFTEALRSGVIAAERAA